MACRVMESAKYGLPVMESLHQEDQEMPSVYCPTTLQDTQSRTGREKHRQPTLVTGFRTLAPLRPGALSRESQRNMPATPTQPASGHLTDLCGEDAQTPQQLLEEQTSEEPQCKGQQENG